MYLLIQVLSFSTVRKPLGMGEMIDKVHTLGEMLLKGIIHLIFPSHSFLFNSIKAEDFKSLGGFFSSLRARVPRAQVTSADPSSGFC